MIRFIAIFGVIAGLIIAVPMIVVMMTVTFDRAPQHEALYGYLTMIVALSAVFVGIKQYRDKVLGGVIKFGPALLVGLGISAVGSIVYAIGWEISLAWSGFDFTTYYSNFMVESARSKGVSQAELERVIAEAQSFATSYRNPLFRLPMTFLEMFPVGILISLISAGLLRNSRLLPARAAK